MNSLTTNPLQATDDSARFPAQVASAAGTAPHRVLYPNQSTGDHVDTRAPNDAVLVYPDLVRCVGGPG